MRRATTRLVAVLAVLWFAASCSAGAPTSALDEDSEAAMYALVRERLPDTAVVSIAHRSTVARWHDRYLRYDTRKGEEAAVRMGRLAADATPAPA